MLSDILIGVGEIVFFISDNLLNRKGNERQSFSPPQYDKP